MRLEKTRDRLNRFLIFPIEVVVFFSAIILVEAGTRAHKLWRRQLNDDLP